jgi:hypothetical protein
VYLRRCHAGGVPRGCSLGVDRQRVSHEGGPRRVVGQEGFPKRNSQGGPPTEALKCDPTRGSLKGARNWVPKEVYPMGVPPGRSAEGVLQWGSPKRGSPCSVPLIVVRQGLSPKGRFPNGFPPGVVPQACSLGFPYGSLRVFSR